MKKILISFLFFALLTGCEDQLIEKPVDFLSKANFYRTAADAESAIAATYATLSGNSYFTIWFMALIEINADYVNGRGSQANISLYQGLDNTNQTRAFTSYAEMYAGINRANAVIENVPNIAMPDAQKNRIIAEAYFLRAFFYTHLVKCFGGVPLRLEETKDLSKLAAPRAPVSDVYNQIIGDLERAIPDLPASIPANQTGRATTWAAKMLLADVYLTTEQWVKARDSAHDVIVNGGYSLIRVNQPDDFLQMYGHDVVTYSENILSIQHTETNGSSVPNFLHRFAGVYCASGVYAWLPNMNSFLKDWDDDDLRKDFNLYTSYVQNGQVIQLPNTSPILFRKYRDSTAPCAGCHRNNIPLYRLAEALLIYAEASNEAEGTPSALALERLNQVKRRAYGYDPGAPSVVDFPSGMTKAEFRDAVLLERGFEFILEGKRWFDLKRTGRTRAAIEATGISFQDISLLFPIPLDEINNNPALTNADQNPGY
jgi:hypothetical protein